MNSNEFEEIAEGLEQKVNMVDEFIERAHQEGISAVEAIAMQNHIRRQFSPKQRDNFRRQIASLYREGKITLEQKKRMDKLLSRASKIADQHFLKLASIVPESQALTTPWGFPNFLNQKLGGGGPKKLLRLFGIGG